MKARYPEASAWLAEKVMERGYADETTGCCRTEHQGLVPDEACCCCTTCDTGVEMGGKHPVNIIELVSGCFRER